MGGNDRPDDDPPVGTATELGDDVGRRTDDGGHDLYGRGGCF